MKNRYEKLETTRNHATYLCRYKVAWYTMYKRPVLDSELQKKFEIAAKDAANSLGIEIEHLETSERSATLMLRIPPTLPVHMVITQLKGKTASVLRTKDSRLASRLPCMWSAGYLVSTVGEEFKKEEERRYQDSLPNSRLCTNCGQRNKEKRKCQYVLK